MGARANFSIDNCDDFGEPERYCHDSDSIAALGKLCAGERERGLERSDNT
jgi:hypothetical protein